MQPKKKTLIETAQDILSVATGEKEVTINYDVPNSTIAKVLLGLLAVLIISAVFSAISNRLINPKM